MNVHTLSYETVIQAVNGNPDAINIVLRYYSRYLDCLSKRTVLDKQGNPHSYIDRQLRQRIENKLIYKISNFNL